MTPTRFLIGWASHADFSSPPVCALSFDGEELTIRAPPRFPSAVGGTVAESALDECVRVSASGHGVRANCAGGCVGADGAARTFGDGAEADKSTVGGPEFNGDAAVGVGPDGGGVEEVLSNGDGVDGVGVGVPMAAGAGKEGSIVLIGLACVLTALVAPLASCADEGAAVDTTTDFSPASAAGERGEPVSASSMR